MSVSPVSASPKAAMPMISVRHRIVFRASTCFVKGWKDFGEGDFTGQRRSPLIFYPGLNARLIEDVFE